MTKVSSSLLPRIGLVTMIAFSVGIALYAFGFQFRFIGNPGFHMRFDLMPIQSTMHVIGGGIVLLIGGFQFSASLRRNRPQLHRWFGRVYLMFVLVGGLGGLMLAPYSSGGLVAHFGFGLLAVLWLFSGWQAYTCIRAGDIKSHRAWMMRNFAMTFGAVTLRLHMGLFAAAGIPFEESYPVVAWLSWVPNLILVEWYLALKQKHAGIRSNDQDRTPLPHAEGAS